MITHLKIDRQTFFRASQAGGRGQARPDAMGSMSGKICILELGPSKVVCIFSVTSLWCRVCHGANSGCLFFWWCSEMGLHDGQEVGTLQAEVRGPRSFEAFQCRRSGWGG